MIRIKTDSELIREKAELEVALKRLKDIYRGYERTLDELYITWRSVKDPIVKKEIHKEIFKLKDKMMFGRVQREIGYIQIDINNINRMLHPVQYDAGYFYDDYRELDYDEIVNCGIRGVRL